MDIKIRCPHCETKLIVGDDLVGQSVLCEECDKQFTVEKPAAAGKSGETRRRERDDRDDDRPRSRRRDEDAEEEKPRSKRPADDFDDEDRPVRRKPKRSSSNLAPMIFGSLLVLMTLLVGVGLFFAFGFGTRTGGGGGGGGGAVPAGGKFRLANPQPFGNNGFTVQVETVDGRPPAGRFQVTWQSPDGMSKGSATLVMAGSRVTFTNPGWGGFGGRPAFNIWIDYEPATGTKLSNVVTLY
jgi:hypothetical protein